MQAIILAGGLGTRLRPYTFTVPKPLLPLGNKALLDHLIEQLGRCGVHDIVLALGYQAQLVRAYFGDGERNGTHIRYVEERVPLGTAGCLSLARPLLPADESFFLMNGDIVTRLDFSAMARFHAEHGAALTMGYVEHTYQSPFGVLRLSGVEIVDIIEKPAYVHPVSAGIYCISPEAAALVPDGTPTTMPELAMEIRGRGGRVVAYRIREFWRALERTDHFDELLQAGIEQFLGTESADGRATESLEVSAR
jgi:NDP-sugar pyrophosphorylase family protein